MPGLGYVSRGNRKNIYHAGRNLTSSGQAKPSAAAGTTSPLYSPPGTTTSSSRAASGSHSTLPPSSPHNSAMDRLTAEVDQLLSPSTSHVPKAPKLPDLPQSAKAQELGIPKTPPIGIASALSGLTEGVSEHKSVKGVKDVIPGSSPLAMGAKKAARKAEARRERRTGALEAKVEQADTNRAAIKRYRSLWKRTKGLLPGSNKIPALKLHAKSGPYLGMVPGPHTKVGGRWDSEARGPGTTVISPNVVNLYGKEIARLAKGKPNARKTVLHEFAHTRQSPRLPTRRAVEGGAEAFARYGANRLNLYDTKISPKERRRYSIPKGVNRFAGFQPTVRRSGHYPSLVKQVYKRKSPEWIQRGQFSPPRKERQTAAAYGEAQVGGGKDRATRAPRARYYGGIKLPGGVKPRAPQTVKQKHQERHGAKVDLRQATQRLRKAAGNAGVQGPLSQGEKVFADTLSKLTGLNPVTVAAWTQAEGGNSFGDYNRLNVGHTDSGPTALTSDAGWSDPVQAAKLTAKFLKGQYGGASSGIQAILPQARGLPPAQQLQVIANSGWATNPSYNSLLQGTAGSFSAKPINPRAVKGFAQAATKAKSLGIPVPKNPARHAVAPGATITVKADGLGAVKWATKVLGTDEGTPRQARWAAAAGVSPDVPWCGVFVNFALKRMGVQGPANPAYSGDWLNWSGGKHVNNPKPGDLVIFDWGDGGITDHIAMYAGNGMVIGGNQSDSVTKVPWDQAATVGIVRPNYKGGKATIPLSSLGGSTATGLGGTGGVGLAGGTTVPSTPAQAPPSAPTPAAGGVAGNLYSGIMPTAPLPEGYHGGATKPTGKRKSGSYIQSVLRRRR